MNCQKPREIAIRLLNPRTAAEGFVEERLELELRQQPISGLDRRLVQELVYGVIRWRATLGWLERRKASRQHCAPLVSNLLALGLYQMFFLDRIPDHAAVNETVELAREFGCPAQQAGFINAILRAYSREREQTRQALQTLKDTDPALGYSHPKWLVDAWTTRWGQYPTRALLEWNNTPPKTFARLNTLRATPAELQAEWTREGVTFAPLERAWFPAGHVYELTGHPPFAELASMQAGHYYLQDPSTLLAVHLLDPQPGERILDLCAAPGGKTTYIAQRMENRGHLLAQDLDNHRLAVLRENLERLGVTCATVARPGSAPAPELDAAFDRVLVDAPCSNTGVMRRRVELRWRLEPSELLRLEAGQLSLLRRAIRYVKPGGCLVYSTCSLEPGENLGLVKKLLAEFPAWQLEQHQELTPFKDGVDGAFVAVLRRGAA
ncbi:MAG: 16S rRNA (cytosine(967)-C(5))-methyltransferase RsmB [Verrucomicrobiota bacterium]